MGFADGMYFGQNKLLCICKKASDNGKTVTVTNGTRTWTNVVADLKCEIDLPGKGIYTVSLDSYSVEVPMGYGEYRKIILAEGYDEITEHDVMTLEEILDAVAELDGKLPDAQAVKELSIDIDNNATAITELSDRITTNAQNITANANAIKTKAPTAHASSSNTYGSGSATNYGHVKLSDAYKTSGGAAADGVAASSKAVNDCYNNRAPIAHASADTTYGAASTNNYGHVKLSNTYATQASGSGIAASQKAVYDAYTASIDFTNSKAFVRSESATVTFQSGTVVSMRISPDGKHLIVPMTVKANAQYPYNVWLCGDPCTATAAGSVELHCDALEAKTKATTIKVHIFYLYIPL